jgi:hypothetical protein
MTFMSVPSYAVKFRGFWACPCLAKWLPAYEKELLRRGVIKSNIDIYQLIGGATASAGTHTKGGAFDIAQISWEAIYVARQMGADATWHRPYNWDNRGGMSHTHGVLRGCDHNYPARYQITAVDDGYNGLGHLGRGGKDTGPRPLSHRTWRQGIAWAEKQAAAVSSPVVLRPDNSPTRKPPKVPSKWAKFYHVTPPRKGDSIHGLNEAKRLGYHAVDLNFQIDKDREVQNTHWADVLGKGGFIDPLHRIKKGTNIQSLTSEEVARLKSPEGYRIRPAKRMIEEAKKLGLRVEFEAKGSKRFEYGYGGLKTFLRMKRIVDANRANVQVKTISNIPGAKRRLAAAHKAGFTTILLPRGTRRVPKSWWPYIDYVRGPVWWVDK